MYRQYNEKVTENAKLKEEIENLRRNYNQKLQQDAHRFQKDD